MFSDLTLRPINANGYSDSPFTFLDQSVQIDLANITAINLIENGSREARERWQNRQLTNLLKHAHKNSKFWRQRMPSRLISPGIIKFLPIQSRADVAAQCKLDGSLVAGDGKTPASSYASTGSTGTPVTVYVAPENGYYNSIRGMAQYFIDGLSLDENLVHIAPSASLASLEKGGRLLQLSESWAGSLSALFRNGSGKKIIYKYNDDALIKELLKNPVGYLVCPNRYLDILMNNGGAELIKRLGVKLWIHNSDYRDPEIVKILREIGVPSCRIIPLVKWAQ